MKIVCIKEAAGDLPMNFLAIIIICMIDFKDGVKLDAETILSISEPFQALRINNNNKSTHKLKTNLNPFALESEGSH